MTPAAQAIAPTPSAPATIAPYAWDADEMAEIAREEAEYVWREQMQEVAQHCRAYREGDWDLSDWLEFDPCGRGYAAAHERATVGMAR